MTCRYKLWIITFWSLLTFFVVIMQGANSAAEFYAKHPRLQQFFPFEVYGEIYCSPKQWEGVDDSWELHHSDLTTVQLTLGRLGIAAFDFLGRQYSS